MLWYEKITKKMSVLCKTSGLTPEDNTKRSYVCYRIIKQLKPCYPDCEVSIYGSTINSYGTKISDLDILFIPYPEYNNVSNAADDKEEVPSVQDINSGKIPKEELLQMNKHQQLKFVCKLLRRDKRFFWKVRFIKARCPILQFELGHLKISCDLSCGSRLVVRNSELLHFYSKIDHRVRQLGMTLRLWAKCLNIIQTGSLSSYAFTLLVIYFLQRTKPPILPSVQELNTLSGLSQLVEGWETAFTTDLNKINKTKNRKSTGELLKEFFYFYWNFDFSRNVVCPHSGSMLPIKELSQLTNDERLNDFEVTALCIQDPFILSQNLGRNMKFKAICSFKHSLFIAIKILDRTDNTETEDSFDCIFKDSEYIKLTNQLFNPPSSEGSVSFHINFSNNTITALEGSENWKEKLYELTCQCVLDSLQYGLLIECEVIDKSRSFKDNAKRKKVGKEKNYELLMTIQCAVYNLTYVGRNSIKEMPSVECDSEQFSNAVLRNEFIISNHLIQENPLLSSPEPFVWFYCDCFRTTFDQLMDTIVVLSPLTKSKEFKSIFSYLAAYLPKTVSKMLPDSPTVLDASTNSNNNVSHIANENELVSNPKLAAVSNGCDSAPKNSANLEIK